MLGISPIANLFDKKSKYIGKYLKNKNIMLKSYLKDDVAPHPHKTLDFNVKFPFLRLLRFLSDLKSTIILSYCSNNIIWAGFWYWIDIIYGTSFLYQMCRSQKRDTFSFELKYVLKRMQAHKKHFKSFTYKIV